MVVLGMVALGMVILGLVVLGLVQVPIVIHKIVKMANCGESCQQFTVKCGVARLRVSQFAGKKTKRVPMVPRLLLHDAADMGIGGISGERKFCVGGRVLEWYRLGDEALCILESLLCLVGLFQCFWPPFREQYLCAIW
jgi:hypothetical protein